MHNPHCLLFQAALVSLALYVLQHPGTLAETRVLAKKLVRAILDDPDTVQQVCETGAVLLLPSVLLLEQRGSLFFFFETNALQVVVANSIYQGKNAGGAWLTHAGTGTYTMFSFVVHGFVWCVGDGVRTAKLLR